MSKYTTIPLIPPVRDRLKSHGSMRDTYSDILTRILDQIERERFIARLRGEVDDPATEWVDLDDPKWPR